MRNVIQVLKERGFIEALTNDEIVEQVNRPLKVYCGFDPTADSLHLGNLVAIMGLAWFQRCGHTPVAIVGGATGLIGDPSGKQHERPLLDNEAIQRNLQGIQKNLEAILDFNNPDTKPIILNNYDWISRFNVIEFLRDVGKHFRIGPMLAKESVRARLASEEGMSFTEFCYQVLQGYDFLYLFENHNVTVQLGGSDQWGNITAGKDLIRKVSEGNCYGVTFPLITKQDGTKFGKSEKGAIWLSPEKLSVYEFYQHLIRTADADVIMLLRMLTFLEMDEIRRLEASMKEEGYVPNTVQRRLAEEVTRIVHGEEALQTAIRVTEGAKPGAGSVLTAETLQAISGDMPNCTLAKNQVVGNQIIDLLVVSKLLASKSEARRMIRSGGLYLNNEKVTDENYVISQENLIDRQFLLLSVGKKSKMLIKLGEI